MGFSVGRYAKVWKIEDKGNYAVCNLSVGKRDSETKVYVNDFKDGYEYIKIFSDYVTYEQFGAVGDGVADAFDPKKK